MKCNNASFTVYLIGMTVLQSTQPESLLVNGGAYRTLEPKTHQTSICPENLMAETTGNFSRLRETI